MEKPEMIVQKQLDAYNAHDLETFLSAYSPRVVLKEHPDTVFLEGIDKVRNHYEKLFSTYGDLRVELMNRIVSGNFIIDHENVHGRRKNKSFEAIAIYHVVDGLIETVWFLEPNPET
jgi:hypothetical protein